MTRVGDTVSTATTMNLIIVLLIASALAIASPVSAQSQPTYIQFSPGSVKGALYKPDSGTAPHVAILIIHRTANVLASPATRELASRGFMVLAVNPRSDNNEAVVNFEANALDIKSGVEFLRKQPGITKILLWGHSGGGPATSFYQAVAEQGPSYCRGPNKLVECDESLAGLPTYPDDNAMVLTRFEGARLMELDPSIHHSTLKPQKLLKNDGTIVTQVVESVRVPARGYDKRNASFDGGARVATLRTFLSANAIRAKDSLDEIDWCSSNNSTDCALPQITIPTLVTAMGAHYFIRDSEIHYERSASRDKEFIVIEGATHGISPCTACESTPGQYGNVTKNFFDYVTRWINERF
jgi:pimeloyl-ACP methyl ester carboxylesterase